MINKYTEDCKLVGTEIYITPKSFACDICNALVLRKEQAVIFMYTYTDTTFPVYDPTDNSRSIKFMRSCHACGKDK